MSASAITANNLVEVAQGVYYSPIEMPLVGTEIITFLKQVASSCPLRRARFCAHPSPQAEQHDMLIVSHCDTYVAPHRHLSKSETFLILEGTADILLFDELGEVESVTRMGPQESGLPFFYRMPPRQFHSLLIESELLVFLESTKGPFTLDDREHATWAPEYNEFQAGKAFIASIVQRWA
jgi:cupin fold WbuC family metalloprotein